ncbi:MAG: DUF4450 domain-containing protein [Verrucomicrobia bacterium]|nr:DUF4450 domain-containing protein [Verrucomicrobiota bacterium]MBU4428478.1 DUF4450 domain-containing protein [Verrucomicrobiota bacterium]MCG2680360.1 DUF4450 domain-containing protein [Kiritimatiellia bacterium]
MSSNLARANCYVPIDGGWRIRIVRPDQPGLAKADLGESADDPLRHRRPLYPPADRRLFLERLPPEAVERLPLRPMILAFNAPRFVLDMHRAGGLLGHLLIGLVDDKGAGSWLYDCAEVDVSYVWGTMEYRLAVPMFAGATVELTAVSLASAAGLALKWRVSGLDRYASLVICYGGASGCSDTHVDETHVAFDAFSPAQCLYDQISCSAAGFTLRRSFDQPVGAATIKTPEYMPPPEGWIAEIHGACGGRARYGMGDPALAAKSPADLVAAAEWVEGPETKTRINSVAVMRVAIGAGNAEGFCVAGMGRGMEKAVANPAAAFAAGLKRCAKIKKRFEVCSPDPYLNSAACMAAFLDEGTWGDLAYVHGGWSWRWAYLGWRIWYGPNVCGMTGRVKTSIENHLRLCLIKEGDDSGALATPIEHKSNCASYNMNEVFLDHVRHYFDYTGDLDLMRKIFRELKGIIDWENRRLRPGPEALYESALNTWVSDSHWYIRAQCTQASAYMLRAHEFMAELAARLGEDASPWRAEATRIHADISRVLWLKREGVFAEARDTLGHRQLHPDPELATLYHAAEFGAASPLQIYQMLHWADTHLESIRTPGGGRQFWSSNWCPNKTRSYTHSTHDIVYAENLNLAGVHCIVGKGDEAMEIVRATYPGWFNGPTPGGLGCQNTVDGRLRGNDEFADSNSMFIRTIAEDVFGIKPKMQDRQVAIQPAFPWDWAHAAIKTSLFSYEWQRGVGVEYISWKSREPVAAHFRLPVRAVCIESVLVAGKEVEFSVQPGFGFTWVLFSAGPAKAGSLKISYRSASVSMPCEIRIGSGERAFINVAQYGASGFEDPQGLLADAKIENGILSGMTTTQHGPGIMFLEAGTEKCPMLLPLPVRVEDPAQPRPRVWKSPGLKSKNMDEWTLIDLGGSFNSETTEVVPRLVAEAKPSALPASQVGFGYMIEHYRTRLSQGMRPRIFQMSDAAWRAKVGTDGVAWTAEGIPFLTAKQGPNIAAVTLLGGFPARIRVPVPHVGGRTLYLMLSGATWPAQSHVVNLRVELDFADGSRIARELVNPFDIGDCWDTWLGWAHDTAANGFENIGGRFGPAGSSAAMDMTQPVEVDTEAHLVAFNLPPGGVLTAISLEAIANDIVFGLMGASVMKDSFEI